MALELLSESAGPRRLGWVVGGAGLAGRWARGRVGAGAKRLSWDGLAEWAGGGLAGA